VITDRERDRGLAHSDRAFQEEVLSRGEHGERELELRGPADDPVLLLDVPCDAHAPPDYTKNGSVVQGVGAPGLCFVRVTGPGFDEARKVLVTT
jgi:hypothetical protein